MALYGTTCTSCGAAMVRGSGDTPVCIDCTADTTDAPR